MGMGVQPSQLNEVKNLAQNYPPNKEGLLQAIQEKGSKELFNKAVEKAKSPIGKAILGKLGVEQKVIDYVSGQVNGDVQGAVDVAKAATTATKDVGSLMDKLNKL